MRDFRLNRKPDKMVESWEKLGVNIMVEDIVEITTLPCFFMWLVWYGERNIKNFLKGTRRPEFYSIRTSISEA